MEEEQTAAAGGS